ncbi:MAG: hypothetical protein PHU64_00880 [Candidatus Omnitrophica bacterium]|nr:hypothetical protein [Candidatus Omnitrophota bacterium]MDD5430320.1 hypothetical protein [Candidatus Omnitrophota bacterium]
MNRIDYTFWLAKQIMSVLLSFRLVNILLLAVSIFAIIWPFIKQKKKLVRKNIQLLYPFLILLAILALGVIFEKNNKFSFAPVLLLIIQIAYCSYLVYRMKGLRLFSAVISLWYIWLSFWVFFVAMLSITGEWL